MPHHRAVVQRMVKFSTKYPVSRGIASYAVIWPLGSCIQQILANEPFDYIKIVRYCLYGSCYVAPTLNMWMTIGKAVWPKPTFGSAITKALVEQVTYTPFAMVSFYFGMSILEGKSIDEGKQEVADKFWPTYKVGACVWPVLQTINYTVVPERNRIPFVSFCSLLWTSFLAYMKHQEASSLQKSLTPPAFEVAVATN